MRISAPFLFLLCENAKVFCGVAFGFSKVFRFFRRNTVVMQRWHGSCFFVLRHGRTSKSTLAGVGVLFLPRAFWFDGHDRLPQLSFGGCAMHPFEVALLLLLGFVLVIWLAEELR